MSKAILIIGESGSGKTTSLRNLPPDETFYIDADGKGLSWKGWRNQYNKQKKHYIKTDDPDMVYKLMEEIHSKQKQFKMRRTKEKGYDKWMDLAQSVFNIVDVSNKLRDDLTVIMLGHAQTSDDGFTCLLTNGRKLNKIRLESKLTTVLLSKAKDGQYVFETKAHNSTAKTPMGAIEEDEIPNDIMPVIKALEEF